MTEFELLKKKVDEAISPEDVFSTRMYDGSLLQHINTEKYINTQFRHMAKIVHPDLQEEDSGELFAILSGIHDIALARLSDKTWGNKIPIPGREPVIIGQYLLGLPKASGSVADIYHVAKTGKYQTSHLLAKIAKSHRDNDLLSNENQNLTGISKKLLGPWSECIPHMEESFLLDEGLGIAKRRVNIMKEERGFVSAVQIRERIPGVDGRTLAWMWKRTVLLLEWIYNLGYIHGAVLPPHLLFYPDNDGETTKDARKHAVRLVGWGHSINTRTRTGLLAIDPEYKNLYAPEVLAKGKLNQTTDLYMAARTMFYLAGNDDGTQSNPDPVRVPHEVLQHISLCIRDNSTDRPQNVARYFEEFKTILLRVYGKPKWHDFNLPER